MSDTSKELDNKTEVEIPYSNCYNCGAELHGMYCHACGQHATSKTPSVGTFIYEYLNTAFIWDSQCLRTIWRLVSRPGQLTREFMEGKFISQENPLKLNMFLLFVFITMFMLFSGMEKANKTIDTFTESDMAYPTLQLQFLREDSQFLKSVYQSPRDTVQMYAPLNILEDHSDIIHRVQIIEDTHGVRPDRWTADVPTVLIRDSVIVQNADGYYVFNRDDEVVSDNFVIFKEVAVKMIDIVKTYLPLIVLFTTPFLAISLALIHYKKKLPLIHHFIFSLHYTAFLEILILLVYVIHLLFSPSLDVLQALVQIGCAIYLIISIRKVYGNGWIMSIIKSLLVYLFYMTTCIIIFFVIFIIAIIAVALMIA
jgi:hypothetical protein